MQPHILQVPRCENKFSSYPRAPRGAETELKIHCACAARQSLLTDMFRSLFADVPQSAEHAGGEYAHDVTEGQETSGPETDKHLFQQQLSKQSVTLISLRYTALTCRCHDTHARCDKPSSVKHIFAYTFVSVST
jgi:hypothetical protein